MKVNNQNGFTIVQAIFILVVLALLGTYMVKLSAVQHSTTTQALLQARAYQAGRSGIEWGIKQVLDTSSCFANSAWLVEGCNVSASCQRSGPFNEGSGDIFIYNLTAVATLADIDSPDYVSRTVEVTAYVPD
jgi:MSHA biogenesis protein MshP